MISTHRHSITRRGACQFAGPFRGKYGAALPHTPLTARTERTPQKTERKKILSNRRFERILDVLGKAPLRGRFLKAGMSRPGIQKAKMRRLFSAAVRPTPWAAPAACASSSASPIFSSTYSWMQALISLSLYPSWMPAASQKA